MLDHEIDEIFLKPSSEEKKPPLTMIKDYLDASEDYLKSLSKLKNETTDFKKIHEFYKLKLENLSQEISDIEKNSLEIKTEINNKTKLYDSLKEILLNVEIKDEHLNAINNPDFENNLEQIQISLNILQSIEYKYDIKAIEDKKDLISNVFKKFMDKFVDFFEHTISRFETESQGELVLHTSLYEKIKLYLFIFDHAKQHDNKNFVLLSRKYLSISKHLYENEFENHLKIVLKSIKNMKKNLKNNMEDIFKVIFESLLCILKAEINFIKSMFHDDQNFVNNCINNIFTDVIGIVLDFIRDSHRYHNLHTINALYKNKDAKISFEKEDYEIYVKFQNKITDYLEDFKNEYLSRIRSNWKNESKTKTMNKIINDIKDNANGEMNIEVINIMIEEVIKLTRGSKGKIEFCIYKMKFINELKNVSRDENRNMIEKTNEGLDEIFERDVIRYVFGDGPKNIKHRAKNVLAKIKEEGDKNENFKMMLEESFKNIVYGNIDEEHKKDINTLFDKNK